MTCSFANLATDLLVDSRDTQIWHKSLAGRNATMQDKKLDLKAAVTMLKSLKCFARENERFHMFVRRLRAAVSVVLHLAVLPRIL